MPATLSISNLPYSSIRSTLTPKIATQSFAFSGNISAFLNPGTQHSFQLITGASTAPTVSSYTFNITLSIQNSQGNYLLYNYSPPEIFNSSEIFFNPGYSIAIANDDVNFTAVLVCLHSDSLITTENGSQKIKTLKDNIPILTPEDTFVPIKKVVQCWLKVNTNTQYHDAIVFEINSLGDNIPSSQLIIDPGHPMCLKSEYLQHGLSALKKAGEYLNNNDIYKIKWNDIKITESNTDNMIRYDLILEDSYPVYMANNVVVKARDDIYNAGYDHKYYDFV